MNRRKAIFGTALLSGAVVTSFSGLKYYLLNKGSLNYNYSKHIDLIGALSETIIPSTDTPGAIEAGVPEFIIRVLNDCVDNKARNIFIYGLEEIDEYCTESFNKSFVDCNYELRVTVLKVFEKRVSSPRSLFGKIKVKVFGKPFFSQLKEYTTIGYCTSRLGATQALAYDYIPGKYVGCKEIQENQKSWATN